MIPLCRTGDRRHEVPRGLGPSSVVVRRIRALSPRPPLPPPSDCHWPVASVTATPRRVILSARSLPIPGDDLHLCTRLDPAPPTGPWFGELRALGGSPGRTRRDRNQAREARAGEARLRGHDEVVARLDFDGTPRGLAARQLPSSRRLRRPREGRTSSRQRAHRRAGASAGLRYARKARASREIRSSTRRASQPSPSHTSTPRSEPELSDASGTGRQRKHAAHRPDRRRQRKPIGDPRCKTSAGAVPRG